MPSPLSNSDTHLSRSPSRSRSRSPSHNTQLQPRSQSQSHSLHPQYSGLPPNKQPLYSNTGGLTPSPSPPPRSSSSTGTRAPRVIPSVLAPTPGSNLTLDIYTRSTTSSPSPASSATTSFQQQDHWSSTDAASFPSSSRRTAEIEMDQIAPAGHRRRRSTLTAAVGGAGGIPNPVASSIPSAGSGSGGRGRAHSIRHNNSSSSNNNNNNGEQSSGSGLDGKITEGGGKRYDDASSQFEGGSAENDDSFSDEDLHDDEETGLTKKDKKRKRAKRRRNTRLDNRIARDKITDEERKQADQNVARNLAINVVLILLWYLFSLSISLYNKWMFDSQRLNFQFPLFTTSMHMLVQFSLSCIVLYFAPSLRPSAGYNSNMGRSRHESEPERSAMTNLFYLTRIGPCGAATGLDIGLGNTSLKFITLTFYTMCKSSSLAFVLIFAFLFRLESPTWKLVGIIATMTMGVVMMVAGEVEFQLSGFVLVISAAFFSGFRWGLTQILLLRNPATSNPFSSIFYLAPVMFVTLLIIAIPVEGFPALFEGMRQLSEAWGSVRAPLILLFPGTIAFLMTASEFALLQRTSVVTLSIAGIFKEVVTISAAALVFDDKLTPINATGLLITIAAIGAYNYIKLSKMRDDAHRDVQSKQGAYQQAQSGSSSDVSEGEEDEGNGLLAAEGETLVGADGDIIPNLKTHAEETRPSRTEHAD